MDKVIDIHKLGMTFVDNGRRLEAENVVVNQGDFVIVTGDNGSGKSSFFHLLTLDGGEAYYTLDAASKINIGFLPSLKGNNILNFTKNERELLHASVSHIVQEDHFAYGMRAYEQLLEYSDIYIRNGYAGARKPAHAKLKTLAERYIANYLGFTSLKEMKKRKITAYSAGQRKIINVLSAFLKCEVCGTGVIFLDEPLNNLDVRNKKLLRDIISDIRRKNPALVILMISHCRIFRDVNKELNIRAGKLTSADSSVSYDCLDAGGKAQ